MARIPPKSGFHGVSWHKYAEKWVVYLPTKLTAENRVRTKYIGLFDDVVEAAKAFDRARIDYGLTPKNVDAIDNYIPSKRKPDQIQTKASKPRVDDLTLPIGNRK